LSFRGKEGFSTGARAKKEGFSYKLGTKSRDSGQSSSGINNVSVHLSTFEPGAVVGLREDRVLERENLGRLFERRKRRRALKSLRGVLEKESLSLFLFSFEVFC